MVIYYAYAGQVISWELWGEHDMNEYTHTHNLRIIFRSREEETSVDT